MADYKTTLSRLLEAEANLTPERATELADLARTITEAKVDMAPVAKLAPVARINPRQAAREQYAALPPLPAGANDAQRLERAAEQARHLAVSTGMRTDENANTYFVPDDGGEAA